MTLVVLMTLLPALLVICGRWVFWPVRPTLGSAEPSATGLWARVGARIRPRPRAVWIGTTAALLVACLGLFAVNARGLSQADSFRGTPESVVGQEVASRHFPAAAGDPVYVLTSADTADEVARAVAATDGIGATDGPAGRRRRRADRRRRWPTPSTARPPTTPSTGCVRASTTSGTARRWSAATPPSTSTSRPPRSATTG